MINWLRRLASGSAATSMQDPVGVAAGVGRGVPGGVGEAVGSGRAVALGTGPVLLGRDVGVVVASDVAVGLGTSEGDSDRTIVGVGRGLIACLPEPLTSSPRAAVMRSMKRTVRVMIVRR
jgi:hypothetical protein